MKKKDFGIGIRDQGDMPEEKAGGGMQASLRSMAVLVGRAK